MASLFAAQPWRCGSLYEAKHGCPAIHWDWGAIARVIAEQRIPVIRNIQPQSALHDLSALVFIPLKVWSL
jgi:hypothetical protein